MPCWAPPLETYSFPRTLQYSSEEEAASTVFIVSQYRSWNFFFRTRTGGFYVAAGMSETGAATLLLTCDSSAARVSIEGVRVSSFQSCEKAVLVIRSHLPPFVDLGNPCPRHSGLCIWNGLARYHIFDLNKRHWVEGFQHFCHLLCLLLGLRILVGNSRLADSLFPRLVT